MVRRLKAWDGCVDYMPGIKCSDRPKDRAVNTMRYLADQYLKMELYLSKLQNPWHDLCRDSLF